MTSVSAGELGGEGQSEKGKLKEPTGKCEVLNGRREKSKLTNGGKETPDKRARCNKLKPKKKKIEKKIPWRSEGEEGRKSLDETTSTLPYCPYTTGRWKEWGSSLMTNVKGSWKKAIYPVVPKCPLSLINNRSIQP